MINNRKKYFCSFNSFIYILILNDQFLIILFKSLKRFYKSQVYIALYCIRFIFFNKLLNFYHSFESYFFNESLKNKHKNKYFEQQKK